MKGKIDSNGRLYIYRYGEMTAMRCCMAQGDNGLCSHDCPAFRDPETELGDISAPPDENGISNGYYPDVPTGRTVLHLCSTVGTLIFSELEDERCASIKRTLMV